MNVRKDSKDENECLVLVKLEDQGDSNLWEAATWLILLTTA